MGNEYKKFRHLLGYLFISSRNKKIEIFVSNEYYSYKKPMCSFYF